MLSVAFGTYATKRHYQREGVVARAPQQRPHLLHLLPLAMKQGLYETLFAGE